jgi:hypothetical protein
MSKLLDAKIEFCNSMASILSGGLEQEEAAAFIRWIRQLLLPGNGYFEFWQEEAEHISLSEE